MNYVFRCYAEKRPGFDVEAGKVFQELREQLGIASLHGVRIFCRYDVDGVDYPVYLKSRTTVFSEPMCDAFYDEQMPQIVGAHSILAVESLPGQFDQRANSCAQCIQLLAGCERPIVRCATIYVLMGELSDQDMEAIRGYLINPVETREASMDKPETLVQSYDIPTSVATLTGFRELDEAGLTEMLSEYGLAMDLNDLKFLQSYFRDEEKRDPTITELRLVDTYWSDHCRHTTFGTHIDAVDIQDPEVRKAYEAYLAGPGGGPTSGEGGPAAPDPDGCGHPGGQGAEEAGRAAQPGRVRGDQRLLHRTFRWTWTARSRIGCSCSRTRPTTTPPRLSPSAARPPASAAPSGIPCPAGPMSIRPCASPAAAIPSAP